MTDTGHDQQKNREASAPGGWRRFRGFFYALGAGSLLAGVIAGAAVFDATSNAQSKPSVYVPPTVAAARTAPAITAGAIPPSDAPSTEQPTEITVPAEAPSASQTVTPTSSVTSAPATTAVVGDAVSATPTLGDAWTSTPAPSTPAPTAGLWPATTALISELEAEWGVDVVTEGQNWGANEAQQVLNIGLLSAALESLPKEVASLATHNDHGTLAVLSNNEGRTLGGWQPYGAGAANFYATEDVGSAGRVETNQIVLQTGSAEMTIAHELLHAYQMRDVSAGRYGEALLTEEMRSFMEATGWTPNVSDEVLAAAVGGSWDEIGRLFDYSGPELVYESENGQIVHAHTPNPVEAFAVVGALYYAAPEGTVLPDWAGYWAWFDANMG